MQSDSLGRQIASPWLPYQAERQLFSGLPSGWSTLEMFLVGRLMVLPSAMSFRWLAWRRASQKLGKLAPHTRQSVKRGLL